MLKCINWSIIICQNQYLMIKIRMVYYKMHNIKTCIYEYKSVYFLGDWRKLNSMMKMSYIRCVWCRNYSLVASMSCISLMFSYTHMALDSIIGTPKAVMPVNYITFLFTGSVCKYIFCSCFHRVLSDTTVIL
jgi:hypothetical protein